MFEKKKNNFVKYISILSVFILLVTLILSYSMLQKNV